jgi:hypothetical protein
MESEKNVDIKVGTVTVFTDGTDRAGRLGKDGRANVMTAINAAKKDGNIYFFSIGLGREIDSRTLKDIGRDMFTYVPFASWISNSFRAVGKRIEALSKCYFMLEYRTPTRSGSGNQDLLIGIREGAYSGSYKTVFDTSKFKFQD